MRMTRLIVGVLMAVPFGAMLVLADSNPPAKIEASTREVDKAAATQASTEADQWAATNKKLNAAPPPASEPNTVKESTAPATSTTAAPLPPTALPGMKPAAAKTAARTDLNEMQGKLLSKTNDPNAFRILVDGGFNVSFSYDDKTTMMNDATPITIDDLEYGDGVIVRYSGKDLYAVELNRISKAAHPL